MKSGNWNLIAETRNSNLKSLSLPTEILKTEILKNRVEIVISPKNNRTANSRFELVCDLVELPFRIIFSAKPKVERLRTTHHLKAAGR